MGLGWNGGCSVVAELRENLLRRFGVELRGVEPLASSMRPRRSSQLSYSPE